MEDPKRLMCDPDLKLTQFTDENQTSSLTCQLKTRHSLPVHTRPFPPETKKYSCCLVIGTPKQRSALSTDLARHCTLLVHVAQRDIRDKLEGSNTPPQVAYDPTIPLLDQPSAMSIALHDLTEHIGYTERTIEGQKFEVAQKKIIAPAHRTVKIKPEVADDVRTSIFDDDEDPGDY